MGGVSAILSGAVRYEHLITVRLDIRE